jgi:hypothetical protein
MTGKNTSLRRADAWGIAFTLFTALLALWKPGKWILGILTSVWFGWLIVRYRWIQRAPYPIGKPLRLLLVLLFILAPAYVGWHISNSPIFIEKHPILKAKCALLDSQSACATKCTIENLADDHNAPAKNVSVGFDGVLPWQTRLDAPSEMHALIGQQDQLPSPRNGTIDTKVMAFTVEIPLIPPKTKTEFLLSTLSKSNNDACEYLATTIRSEQRRELAALLIKAAQKGRVFDLDKLITAQAKSDVLFTPGYLMDVYGRQKIEFLSQEEEIALKKFNEWIEEADGNSNAVSLEAQCTMPVFAAETDAATPRYFLKGSGLIAWAMPLKQRGFRAEADYNPPPEYSCISRTIATEDPGFRSNPTQ